jgi:hypothetical protein
MNMTELTKECTGCHRTLALGEFSVGSRAKDGKQYQCKECNTAYRAVHREEIAAKQAAWRAAHPAYGAAYRAAHRDEQLAYYAAYRAEHKAEKAAYNAAYNAEHKAERAAYRAEHKTEIAAHNHTRRARKKAVGGKFTADNMASAPSAERPSSLSNRAISISIISSRSRRGLVRTTRQTFG